MTILLKNYRKIRLLSTIILLTLLASLSSCESMKIGGEPEPGLGEAGATSNLPWSSRESWEGGNPFGGFLETR